jgi:hypothetical protein
MASLALPPATKIVAAMERAALGGQDSAGPAWASPMVALVESNLRQWDLEDATRERGASDAQVAAAKRQIDHLNVGRHRLVEEIDAAIDSVLDQATAAPLATESPGMVLDRLSVLVIRRTRTAGAFRDDPACGDRLRALEIQIAALAAALDSYMDELRAGTRRFLRYQSLKLYGRSAAAAASVNE